MVNMNQKHPNLKKFHPKRGKFDHKSKFGVKKRKWQIENDEIEQLKTKYENVSDFQLKSWIDLHTPTRELSLRNLLVFN